MRFVKRDTARLDAERIDTPLGPTLVTTPEQTVLDLAHRPDLGDSEVEIPSAVAALYERSDQELLRKLAGKQRRLASLETRRGMGPTMSVDERDAVAQQFGVAAEQVKETT